MCAVFSFRTWFILSLIWAGAMFYLAYSTWPQVPLDISPIDPATVEAMRGALLKHCALLRASRRRGAADRAFRRPVVLRAGVIRPAIC